MKPKCQGAAQNDKARYRSQDGKFVRNEPLPQRINNPARNVKYEDVTRGIHCHKFPGRLNDRNMEDRKMGKDKPLRLI
jgi:hypothetical protein